MINIVFIGLRILAAVIVVFLFSRVAGHFSHISVCSDYMMPNSFYLIGTLVPVILAFFYTNKFPVITMAGCVVAIPLYTMFILNPQRFYLESVIQRLCDAYNPLEMSWKPVSSFPSVYAYLTQSAGKYYLWLYLAGTVIVTVALIYILFMLFGRKDSSELYDAGTADDNESDRY